ncbi:MAG TPA: ABC transporter ATP-binding protein [Alphaproteobacteria bacterium]|nr:ABC transporter ATP-binding protein [Alphaproteobacteria bacterium]
MLRVTDIHAAYGAVPVLNGVSLSLAAGEILTLLGRNGVGKTTLMRTIIGLLKPTAGNIELDGAAVAGLQPHAIARRGVAFVPQGRGIFAKLTVHENLLAGTRARSDGKETIPDEIYEYFPILRERLSQAGGTLSGGEQQMLAFARALCGAPRIMLLDEPSEGIQPNIVAELGRIIGRIAAGAGMAVLLVEQNIDLALQVAHRTLVMEKGRIVHEGKPDDFRDDTTLRKLLAI